MATYIKRKKIIDTLQQQLSCISTILQALDTIKQAVDDAHLDLEYPQLNEKVQTLIQELHCLTFNSPSMLYFEGRVLSCYYKIKNLKEQFADIWAYVGRIDAYFSIAKLYQSQTSKTPICFAQFKNSTHPQIENEDFWNLMIAPDKVVPNSLVVDANIILTGPNAGGKSTAIKSLLQNILLAQTFGIATGSKFTYTPFAKVASYLNITDNLAHGKSLFQAEVERAQSLLTLLELTSNNQLFFCAIDELFTGTSAESGEQCALNFAKKLGMFKNCMFVFATHYQALTLLANNNSFINMQMNVPSKIDGKLVYPFTIAHGISTTNFALDILQEHNVL